MAHQLCHQWSSVVITGSSLVSSAVHRVVHQWSSVVITGSSLGSSVVSSVVHQWFITGSSLVSSVDHHRVHQWCYQWIISGSSVVVITGVISRDDTTDEHYFNVLMDVLATYAKYELLYSLADYAESTGA